MLWHACSIHKDASEQMRRDSASKSQRPSERSAQTTLRGKRTLEEAEDRGQSKRAKTKTKPDVVSFSAKERAAVCTEVTATCVQSLLQDRFKHLASS